MDKTQTSAMWAILDGIRKSLDCHCGYGEQSSDKFDATLQLVDAAECILAGMPIKDSLED